MAMDFDFDIGDVWGGAADATPGTDSDPVDLETDARKPARRRTSACTFLSKGYEYRRAFSEVSLLEAMGHEPLKPGHVYSFITGGDVDALSFLKVCLNGRTLDHLLFSTWCMAAEDVLQVRQWYEAGRVAKVDMYLGEIFPNSYRVEWEMVRDFYRTYPDAGRAAVFRNHSKVFAGCNVSEGFWFGIQTSANINTNPRTENGCIIVDRGIYEFYKKYFDGIVSFEKEMQTAKDMEENPISETSIKKERR